MRNIIQIKGKVASGGGKATGNFKNVKELIGERTGLPALEDGTLNVQMEKHFPITAVTGVITNDEYKREQECIKLRRCRVRKAGENKSVKAVIVRPSQHEDPDGRPTLWRRIELMSDQNLRQNLSLTDDDEVEIEVEKETVVDEDWWNA
ncbi:MAG: DUF120 domain-containing protein [Planctomycetaceae bacterium]|nr:DUF120 domain-containing protein [Planctomycetaceae bacterium]